MKIAVYTITKNEEQFIKRWADSCVDADYRLVVDTGSTDDTIYEALANGCEVTTITINPWRFDDARNTAGFDCRLSFQPMILSQGEAHRRLDVRPVVLDFRHINVRHVAI